MPMNRLTAAALGLALMLTAAPGLAQVPADAPPSDKLIFADRDFSGAAQGLAWRMDREGKPAEGFQPVTDARLTLTRTTDPKDGKPMLEMRETGGGIDRVVGRYPVEGMDPVLVYFLETTTRNMSALAQGSADYIRNRMKAALRDGAQISAADGVSRVVLMPFANDPNGPRMQGFDKLTVTLDIPTQAGAPIRSLTAEAPGTGYALRLTQVAP